MRPCVKRSTSSNAPMKLGNNKNIASVTEATTNKEKTVHRRSISRGLIVEAAGESMSFSGAMAIATVHVLLRAASSQAIRLIISNMSTIATWAVI